MGGRVVYDALTKEEVFAKYANIIPLRYSDVFHLVMGHIPAAIVNEPNGNHIWVYRVGRNAVTLGDTPFGTIPPFPSTVDFYEDRAMDDWCHTGVDSQRPTPIGRGLAARHNRGSNGTNVSSCLPSIRRVRVVDSTRDALDVANAS